MIVKMRIKCPKCGSDNAVSIVRGLIQERRWCNDCDWVEYYG